MSRPLRIDFPGAFHHITARANEKKAILKQSVNKNLLLKCIKKGIEQFQFKLHAFIIMDNHFHLLFQSCEVSISRIMQNIIGNFTMIYNKKYKRTGHLFQGRFKSCLIDNDNYLLTCAKYIHNNCKKAGICTKLEDYRWSSYRYYLNIEKKGFLEKSMILSQLNYNIDEFKKYMNNYQEDDLSKQIMRVRNYHILGKKSFIEKIIKKIGIDERKSDRKISLLTPDKIIEIVANYYNLKIHIILVKNRSKKLIHIKKIAIYLLRYYSHLTMQKIGEKMNITTNAVSEALKTIQDYYINKAKSIIDEYL